MLPDNNSSAITKHSGEMGIYSAGFLAFPVHGKSRFGPKQPGLSNRVPKQLQAWLTLLLSR